jgi:NAD+ kinase
VSADGSVRAVGLVPHRDRPLSHLLAQSAAAWFHEREVEVRIPHAEAEAAGLAHLGVDADTFAPGLDLVLSLGGDGTMLQTVQLVYRAGVPIIGVNAGQLGYLTAIEPEELDAAFPRLLARDYAISERMMLEVETICDGVHHLEYGLNEAVLEREQAGHLIRFNLKINGTPFTSYAADGVIVATPTGSTAYSFSARGPIASPELRCTLLTPISAHMLFDRSLVLAEHEELEFEVAKSREVVCAVDGRRVAVLSSGDRVLCRPAPAPLRLIELRARDFHQILRHKFSLPDR